MVSKAEWSSLPFRNVPAIGQAEEECLCQCHSLWNQQQQLHFWSLGLPRPGACLSGEEGAGEKSVSLRGGKDTGGVRGGFKECVQASAVKLMLTRVLGSDGGDRSWK